MFFFVLYGGVGCSIVFLLGPILGLSKGFGGEAHDGYIELARSLVAGFGYVFEEGGTAVFHRPPAYVFMLMPGALLSEMGQKLYVIFLNAACVAGTLCVLRVSAERFIGSCRVGVLASLLFLTNPWVYWMIKNPMSIIFQMFIYALLFFFLYSVLEDLKRNESWGHSIRGAFLLGVVGGVGALTHGVIFPLFIVLSGGLILWNILWRRYYGVLLLGISVFLVILTVLPWSIRNYTATGKIIPVAGNTGIAFYAGNAYWSIVKPGVAPNENIYDATLRHAGVARPYNEVMHFWGLRDADLDQKVTTSAKNFVVSHPLYFSEKFVKNALGYYFPIVWYVLPSREIGNHKTKQIFSLTSIPAWTISVYYFLFWVAIVVSCLRRFDDWGQWMNIFLIFIPGFLLAMSYWPFLTFVGHSLYVFGTLPFLYMCCAYGIENNFFKKVRRGFYE